MSLPVEELALPMQRKRWRVTVRGTVQGVGFRPFVWHRAVELGLAGWVSNSPQGVVIEAEGGNNQLEQFIHAIQAPAPANAVVTGVEVAQMALRDDASFVVRHSETSGVCSTQVVADLATCSECLREVFDPRDRRYRYPFINCTQCGPRYSIVESLPYDRARTSMHRFAMCDVCQREYNDPSQRRFHAEPNACPECGPTLTLLDSSGGVVARGDDALLAAAAALREGRVIAVKGIGGFHLMADAGDEAAVLRLRVAKGREQKPFAVMFPTLADVRAHCKVSAEEAALLCGTARPIVLLQKTPAEIAPAVTAGNARLGALLPYSPLHHLLLHEVAMPIVATSANVSDEPIISNEADALDRFAGNADLFLVHDRPIVRPIDDSVTQVVLGEAQLLRRARGYAPAPVMSEGLRQGIVAFGGHLKASIAVTCDAGTVLSHHLGDLQTLAARDAHAAALTDLTRLFAAQPRLAVCDLHPDYASTVAARASGLPVVTVQHHVAHVAAAMAEHGLAPPVLGVAWDGVGYGTDGTLWGGEFLAIGEGDWRRVAHLRAFRLPGGEAAMREPARAALGLLYEIYGEQTFGMTDLAPLAHFSAAQREVLSRMLRQGINSPVTTSAGRLFDAFSALCGLLQRSTYEGQAASAFEWCAQPFDAAGAYSLTLHEMDTGMLQVDWEPALREALSQLRAGQPAGSVSSSLHQGLANAIALVSSQFGARRVVLTGGCFQNTQLTQRTVTALRARGCEPFWHRHVPPNDGGLALGQAAWAAWSKHGWREQKEQTACV